MNNISDLGLDLENLFQPAWAQGKSEPNKFEKFTGEEGVKPERRRDERSERPRGPRREGGGEGRPPRAGGGGKFGDRKGRRREERRDDRRERPEPPAPLPEIAAAFLPDEKGVESLARQIKMTGRAYPLFQIAQLILQKPERYAVRLDIKKKRPAAQTAEGSEKSSQPNTGSAVVQPLFVCALDDTPWLSEDEVVAHVLKNHFATFYQAERTAIEPPKGTYTFVAQCAMSGIILGPPNHHDYQNRLRKLHAERFARMPFDVFKSRVKIVKDEAVVKKWVEEQSFKTEYVVLNVPEPVRLPGLEEVEKHFRATHKEAIIKSVETHTVAGVPSRNLRCRELYRLIRAEWEQQRHFPLQLATELSRQFATHGLQFFKVNKTFTHVSVARPLFLDLETTPVSENIKRIIAHINAHSKCSRRQLIETLAPTPQPTVIEIKPETEPSKSETPAAPAAATVPTPEQNAIIADLHWLIHQGHVIEFADGRLETAKKPLPKPPKPEKKPAAEKPVTESEVISTIEPVSQTEVAAAPTPENQALPVESSASGEAPIAPPESGVTPPGETTGEAVESPS